MHSLTRRSLFAGIGAALVIGGASGCGGSGTGDKADATMTAEDYHKMAEVRRAIRLLFDRRYIVEKITQSDQVPASTFVCPGVSEPDGTEFFANAGRGGGLGYYDVVPDAVAANFEAAVDVLKRHYTFDEASGTFTDFPALTYLYNTSETNEAIGEYLQSTLAGVGITLHMENQDWATFLNTRDSGDFCTSLGDWIMDYSDPISMLDLWTSGSGNNAAQFGRGACEGLAAFELDLTPYGYETKVEEGTWAETYDVLIGTIDKELDQEKRFQLMHLAEDMLMDTGCVCPLYYYTNVYLLDREVQGHFYTPLGFNIFKHATFGDGTINVCMASEPDTIDPALNATVDGNTLLMHLFSGVAKWEMREDGTYGVEPDLVREMVKGKENEDGSVTYTYTLRDGLTWSDGQPLTARDFEFAWKRAASDELGASYGEMYSIIKGYDEGDLAVSALDDTTLEVTTTNYIAYWDELMAYPVFYPTREDVVANEAWATDASTYVCCGAYALDSWEHNSLITLKKRDDYWDAENVTMNEINFYLSDDQNSILANYETGTLQLIDSIPSNEKERVKREYADELHVDPYAGTYYVCWNINEDILPS